MNIVDSEKKVSTGTSVANISLIKMEPGRGGVVSIKYTSGMAQEAIIWYQYRVDAAQAFENFTGKHSDKIEVFRVKKHHMYFNEKNPNVLNRTLSVFCLN